MGKLARLQAHHTNINKITEYFSAATARLAELADDELAEFYSLLSKVVGRAWKTECAVIYELVRRVSDRDTHPHSIVANMLGVSRTTVYAKEAVWRIFFQDPESEAVKEKEHDPYIFEDQSEGSTWFIEALKMPDPIEAIRLAERRMQEFLSEGRRYTIRDFKSDLDMILSENRMEDEHPLRKFDPQEHSIEKYLEGGVLKGDYRNNVRQASLYIEKAISSLADEIINLIDADGRLLERAAASLNVLVSDLRTIMYELRLMLGDATVSDVDSSIGDKFSRIERSPIVELVQDMIEESMKEEETSSGKTIEVDFEVLDEDIGDS